MQEIIRLQNISKIYNKGENEVKALENISLSVQKGDFLSIIGSSGSGKSTLMNILGCLDYPDTGKYFLLNKNVSKLREYELSSIRQKNIGFVFQKFNLISTLDAVENVALPLVYSNISKSVREKRAKKALEAVGLEQRLHHKPNELSGGQQQRVAIARAIAANPEIILADEPTGNLDSKSSEQIMQLLTELNENGKTIILITHDPSIASVCKRCITVKDGKITDN